MLDPESDKKDHFRESDYLRDGSQTTLSDSWLKKISIKMDKKRESKIRDGYFQQASKTKLNVASEILENIDLIMWSDLMREKRGINIAPNQILEAIIPHKENPIVIRAKNGIGDSQLNLLIEIIGRKITHKRLPYNRYNWNALNEMVDRVFKP